MFNKDATPGARGNEPPPPARVPGGLAKESHVAAASAAGDEEFSMVSPPTQMLKSWGVYINVCGRLFTNIPILCPALA